MNAKRRNWNRDELIAAFNLYCRTPFGRIHRSNPQIVVLANAIGRTPSAVAMKMVNFASFDPAQRRRDVHGLAHAGKPDRQIWDEFHSDWERLTYESERALNRLHCATRPEPPELAAALPTDVPTEARRMARVRLVQAFFRATVLCAYGHSCAVCALGLTKMLNASHIVPWSKDERLRADPHNGLCLCSFHDRAFDRGLFSLDKDFRVMLSHEVKTDHPPPLHRVGFLDSEGRRIALPERFIPAEAALQFHRTRVFLG